MQECRRFGNGNCQVLVRFDTCGAYASNRTLWGVGWGSTRAAAEELALQYCGPRCDVVVSRCE